MRKEFIWIVLVGFMAGLLGVFVGRQDLRFGERKAYAEQGQKTEVGGQKSDTTGRPQGQVLAGKDKTAGDITLNTGFVVNSTGNLVKVNNVAYSWPVSQGAASQVLSNDGAGTLTWGPGERENIVVTTADVTNSTVTLANVAPATGPALTFEMLASKTYIIEAWLIFQSAATGTGLKVALNGPTSPVAVVTIAHTPIAAATLYASCVTLATRAYETGLNSASVDVITSNLLCKIDGIVRNGTNAGPLAIRFASETAAVVVTIKAGSVLRYRQVD